MTPGPARCSGPPPTWAGWSGTPTSSTRRCWPGAPRCCTRASRWAPRTRARSGGWSPSTRSRRCSPRRPRSARSRRRTREGELAQRVRPVRIPVPVPGRGAAGPGDVPVGGRAARRPGHRPLVADRDRLGHRRRPDGPGSDADQGRVAHHAGARLRRAHPRRRRHRGQAGRDRRDRGAAAAAAGLPAHAVARRRAVRRVLHDRRIPAATPPATAGTATATATCT